MTAGINTSNTGSTTSRPSSNGHQIDPQHSPRGVGPRSIGNIARAHPDAQASASGVAAAVYDWAACMDRPGFGQQWGCQQPPQPPRMHFFSEGDAVSDCAKASSSEAGDAASDFAKASSSLWQDDLSMGGTSLTFLRRDTSGDECSEPDPVHGEASKAPDDLDKDLPQRMDATTASVSSDDGTLSDSFTCSVSSLSVHASDTGDDSDDDVYRLGDSYSSTLTASMSSSSNGSSDKGWAAPMQAAEADTDSDAKVSTDASGVSGVYGKWYGSASSSESEEKDVVAVEATCHTTV